MELRIVQLDLARQMETVAYVKEFISFASKCGYSHVMFYLEARVKTPSFPYPKRSESYTLDEMSEIVKHAEGCGVEIIPQIQIGGHAELFLKYPEMERFSELRDTDGLGRWNSKIPHVMFCFSNLDCDAFLENYICEVSAVFPSRYFHVGMDEAWHVGICNSCRGKDQRKLFGNHLMKFHRILAGLGKRMMIWDDMLQHYSGIVQELPKDIIIMCWNYGFNVDELTYNLGGGIKVKKTELLTRLGFDVIIAPADDFQKNIGSFTKHAENNPKVIGGVLTMWEKYSSFYLSSYPVVAYAGALWNGQSSEQAEKTATVNVFGTDDPALIENIFLAANLPPYPMNTDPYRYCCGTISQPDYLIGFLMKRIIDGLKSAEGSIVTENGKIVLRDVIRRTELRALSLRLYAVMPECMRMKTGRPLDELKSLMDKYVSLNRETASIWESVRPGIGNNLLEEKCGDAVNKILGISGESGYIRFRLHTYEEVQDVDTWVLCDGSDEWQELTTGRMAPLIRGDLNSYERNFRFPSDRLPKALKFSTRGLGTQGLAHFEIHNGFGTFIPHAILGMTGRVFSPESALINNDIPAILGGGYRKEDFIDSNFIGQRTYHSITFSLAKRN